ncbi:hypothetical protein [uncultured Cloacibacillus sp.]|uniref:phage nozzle protein n=1 Tax=uncultured Cloacibacillus sp. TaxID=889794 RepID=UPI003208A9B3
MAYFPSQVSFAAGELAPSLYGREDLAKYAVGLRTLKNFTVHPHGGVSNRAGMRYVAEAKHAGKAVRLVPFEYSDADAYLLEFGDEYVRFYKNGAQLAKDGSPYELETPYLEGELRALSFAQSADVLFIVHPNHPPMELARYADTSWTLEKCSFKGGPFRTMNSTDTTIALSSMTGNVTLTASAALFNAGHAGALFSVFHHVDEVTKKTSGNDGKVWESVFIQGTLINMVPVLVCADEEQLAKLTVGSLVRFGDTYSVVQSVSGNVIEFSPSPEWQLEVFTGEVLISSEGAGWPLEITAYEGWHVLSSGFWGGTVRLQRYDEDEARWTDIYTFTSGSTKTSCKNYDESGTVEEPTRFRLTAESFETFLPEGNTDADRGYFELTAEAADYECCIRINSVTSATVAQGTFEKDAASTRTTRNWSEGAWSDYRGWPCAVGFNQDRLCFGGNASEPQNVWMSVTGDYYNFERHLVLQDDDAVTASLVSRKVSPVRAFVPLSSLVVLTAGAEWTISAGGTKSAITPSSLEANVQGYRGASMVTPVVIGNMVLFVQKQGKIIRDLGYAFESDSYSGNDLTVLATHLFKDRTVAAMDYQQDPDSIVWVALDDGSLLALTYLREQDVVAWSRIETDGEVESVCCLSSAERDEVWLAVKRQSGDGYKRFIEQMAARSAESPQECFFVDCGVTKRYETPQSEITGLSHLEGRDAAVLADGNVIKGLTVENGKITLKHPASVVHVGLPYRAELETLDLTLPRQDGTQQGRSARLISVAVRVEKSRGIKIGAAEGDPVPFEAMEFKERSTEPYGAPISLTTGIMTLGLNAGYSSGRVRVIADEPLPCTVISLLPKVAVASGR